MILGAFVMCHTSAIVAQNVDQQINAIYPITHSTAMYETELCYQLM